MLTIKFQLSIMLLILMSSCSGYRVRRVNNPFDQYGITSLSVPMFINRSTIPYVSAPFTKEFMVELNKYTDLKIYNGESQSSQAILIGIIKSNRDIRKTLVVDSREEAPPNSIGKRESFLIPSETRIQLTLQVILIKNPTHLDKKLLKSKFSSFIKNHPKVIFNEEYEVNREFRRTAYELRSVNNGGVVNYTNNYGTRQFTIEMMAKDAALTFKDLVLDVF